MAVENATFQFDKLYSYAVPEHLLVRAVPGARVLVPFGASKPRIGVILRMSCPPQDGRMKALIEVEDGVPLLSDELVKLVFFLKERTLCTYFDAVRTVLPKNSRLVAGLHETGARILAGTSAHLETAYRAAVLSVLPRLTEKQRAALDFIGDGERSFAEISEATGVSRDVVRRLLQNGIITEVKREKIISLYSDYERYSDYALTPAQRCAFEKIVGFIEDESKPDTTLLHGVTSSGKTLVYSELVRYAAQKGRTALLLVPEIALATQMILRFRELFGERVGIIHSALSDTERQLQWRMIRDGGCVLVVGTRSAVFSPLPDIGIIIVDEEQEQSYLAEQNPRYSAVSVAEFRCAYHGAHLLLSSATPSVESFYAAETGRFNFAGIGERYQNMPLPAVRVVDMRNELLQGNSLAVSRYLKEEIEERLRRKEQSILLLNRRGYRTVSICTSCKTVVKCKSCDTAMVYHKAENRYLCHYCGRYEPFSDACALCGGTVRQTGLGTQKIEEELSALFPKARILRLDFDAAGPKHALEQKIRAFSAGAYDMIIGTQMIAKGLDFKNVTLVGVLSIDQLLLLPSFRANERTFAMLTQVVGRSGRGEREGEAVIQTIDPEHPVIRLAAEQDYRTFYETEIVSRKLHLYPPFCAVSSAGFIAPGEGEALRAAEWFAKRVEEKVTGSNGKIPLRLLGPSPMRIPYANDLYRFKITFKSRGDRAFRGMIGETAEEYYAEKELKSTRMYINFHNDGDL